MDYSHKAVNTGVVDSPPSHGVPLVVNSPSLLRGKAKLKSSKFKSRDSNGVQRNLCFGLSPALHQKSLMVQLSNHLLYVCTEILSFSSNL